MSLTTTDFLGPLTTSWTPPSPCLSTVTYNPHAIWAPDASGSGLSEAVLLGATGQAVDLVCYPPQFTVDRVYSPGVCPSGWTSACAPSNKPGTPLISSPTTAVQCCPSGLSCSQFLWCVQDPTPTIRDVWSLWTGKWGIDGVMAQTSFPSNKVMAKPIIVAYQSSDQAILAAAASATQSGNASVGADSSAFQPGSPKQADSLSAGTIAGIAVGSAVGGVIFATVLTFVFLRFCLGYRKMRGKPEDDTIQLKAHEVDGAQRHELDNGTKWPDGGHGHSQQSLGSAANELPSDPRRAELSVGWKNG